MQLSVMHILNRILFYL